MAIDHLLFEYIQQFAGRNGSMDQFIVGFSKYGLFFFLSVFVWLWFTKSGEKKKNREIVLFAITVAVITLGVDKLIELTYFRARPFVNHDVQLSISKSSTDPSFPSNHAAGSFALAFVLIWKRRIIGSLLLISAFFMAFSRVFIGVHYPSDVSAGAVIALFVTFIIIWQRSLFKTPFTWFINLMTKPTIRTP